MPENSKWSFKETELSGVFEIQPFCLCDNRGFFLKDYTHDIFLDNIVDYNLRETFYSFSKKNVIRGMHFQREKQMSKLVRCLSGKIFDVVCDLRENSNTFGKWKEFILSGENMKQLLIPGGFAHGFLAIEDSLVSYKCGEVFCAEYDDGIIWNDPDIGVNWNIPENGEIIISEKDKNLQTFKEFTSKYKYLK